MAFGEAFLRGEGMGVTLNENPYREFESLSLLGDGFEP
jgi:hypothetical protein